MHPALAYGLLTIILTFIAAIHVNSFWGMACAVVAAGVTYLFQIVDMNKPVGNGTLLDCMWATVVLLVLASWSFITCA